jgi:uncharacterized protein YjiS (DUF1127 family)
MEAANPSPTFTRRSLAGFVPRIPFRQAALLLIVWYERHLQRHALASLDARMLRDLGLGAEDVRRECAKPFWR